METWDSLFLIWQTKETTFTTFTKRELVVRVEDDTIRHVNCAILIKEGERCLACTQKFIEGEAQSPEKKKTWLVVYCICA